MSVKKLEYMGTVELNPRMIEYRGKPFDCASCGIHISLGSEIVVARDQEGRRLFFHSAHKEAEALQETWDNE